MTKRQAEAYAVILTFWKTFGYGPTYDEIALALGINQSSAWRLVKLLIDQKRVIVYRSPDAKKKNSPRSLTPVSLKRVFKTIDKRNAEYLREILVD